MDAVEEVNEKEEKRSLEPLKTQKAVSRENTKAKSAPQKVREATVDHPRTNLIADYDSTHDGES